MTTWWGLALELENAIQRRLAEFTHDLWKEDAITIDVARAARNVLNGATIDNELEKAKVLARIFKADGDLEERFGDLVVLVKVTYRDGQKLHGAAFYEAKRRDWNTHKLPAAKKGQLAHMHRALWNGHLLVFDRERVVTRLTEVVYAPWWWDEPRYRPLSHLAPVTQALAIPLGPVLQTNKFDTSLYKFGTPFSCQLILRNLQGLDLDDHEQALSAASAYATLKDVPARAIIPRIVLAVAVHEGPGDPELPEVNEELLKPVQGN